MYSSRLLSLRTFVLLTLAPLCLHAQTSAGWAEWESLSPQGEEFTVLMPKNPSVETAKVQYHKMELTSRLYLSSIPNGPLVAIASFNGIKSNPAQYTELQRFNSYVDAFKNWFPAKATGKEGVAKLTLVGSHNFHGYDGREYALTVGELTGVLHAYATRKRFYAIISLNTKKDETIREKFLSSFILPDKPPENRTTATNQANAIDEQNVEPETSEGPTRRRGARRSGNSEGGSVQGGEGQENAQATNEPTGNHTPNTQTNAPAKRGPINGGMLNGRAIYLPLPEVAAGEATGVVLVQVLIDEQGAVIEARAVSGPPQLQAAAVNAARLARFNPTLLMGEPVRVSGTLSYNFVKSN